MLKNTLILILGNAPAQRILRFIAFSANYFMGIGSGSAVEKSGEKSIFKLLLKHNSESFCIFDVGANQGQFLRLCLAELQNELHIHAFEPAFETFQMLSKSIGADSRITLNNCGIGKNLGTLDLYYDQEGSGLASLSKRRLDHFNLDFSKSEKVTIDTIDNYCFTKEIEHIDLLKIDVEGHELDVLLGASGMIDSGRVSMITFEFGGCNIDSRTFFQDFYYLLTSKGMSLFRITPSGYLQPINVYSEELEQFSTTNFLALL